MDNSLIVRYWTDIVDENYLALTFDVNGDVMLTPNGWPVRCRTDYNVTLFNNNPDEELVLQRIKNAAPLSFFRVEENKITNSSNLILNFQVANNFVNTSNSWFFDTGMIDEIVRANEVKKSIIESSFIEIVNYLQGANANLSNVITNIKSFNKTTN
jgi:hypothetical protein